MAGTVYLGGGGSPEDEQALWRRMLAGRSRLLYWPLALPDSILAGAAEWLAGALARFDFSGNVECWTSLEGHKPTELDEFDLLFVGGGNTFKLLNEVRRHGFLGPVREFVQRGRAYYGGSAGALLACDDISTAQGLDPNDIGLTDLRSLGLLRRLAILPHYQPVDENAAQEWARQNGTRLVGLPERTGLVVTTAIEVVGDEPAWLFDGDRISRCPPGTILDRP